MICINGMYIMQCNVMSCNILKSNLVNVMYACVYIYIHTTILQLVCNDVMIEIVYIHMNKNKSMTPMASNFDWDPFALSFWM